MEDYLEELKKGAEAAIEHYRGELSSIHTGRATTGLISDILVDAYGAKTPLKQVGNITVSDPRTLAVQPWDKGNLVQIESALRDSEMFFGIVNAGDKIIVSLSELTEEKRQQYIKLAKEKAEEVKVSIRNSRRDIWENVKKLKSDGKISEDEMYRREEEINKLVENKNKEIDSIFMGKERELKEV